MFADAKMVLSEAGCIFASTKSFIGNIGMSITAATRVFVHFYPNSSKSCFLAARRLDLSNGIICTQ